jgi:hypothetical protein
MNKKQIVIIIMIFTVSLFMIGSFVGYSEYVRREEVRIEREKEIREGKMQAARWELRDNCLRAAIKDYSDNWDRADDDGDGYLPSHIAETFEKVRKENSDLCIEMWK